MNTTVERSWQPGSVSVVDVLYGARNPLPGATAGAPSHRAGRSAEGLGATPKGPVRRGGALLCRLLRGVAGRIAASRDRWSGIAELSKMSDRDLADIGMSRSQIPSVYGRPESLRAHGRRFQAASDLEERMLADLGLSRTLPRPMAGGCV